MNVGQADRYIRVIFGLLLLVYAFAGGPIWSFVGFYMLVTGAWAVCPVYNLLNFTTNPDSLEDRST